MNDMMLKLYVRAQIFREDNGQDLIEYALVAAIIALAAVVSMKDVATNINSAFSKISGNLSNGLS